MRRKEREACCKEELLLKEDAMQDNEQVEQEALHMGEEVQRKQKKMEIGNQAEWEEAIKTACSEGLGRHEGHRYFSLEKTQAADHSHSQTHL